MMELCWAEPTEMCLELLTETPKGTSLGWSSVELMAIQMVLMTESDLVELTEVDLDQLTGKQKSLVRLSAERTVKMKVILLD